MRWGHLCQVFVQLRSFLAHLAAVMSTTRGCKFSDNKFRQSIGQGFKPAMAQDELFNFTQNELDTHPCAAQILFKVCLVHLLRHQSLFSVWPSQAQRGEAMVLLVYL